MKKATPQGDVGVVLDFDGTIVRSMELHAEAYRRSLAPFGVKVTDEAIFDQEGARSETIIGAYLETVGKRDAATVKRVSDEKQETYKRLGPPALYPGAAEMVRAVRKAAPKLGLVTGTRRENLERIIPDLVPLFDALLSQESYSHDKPHPEPYEKTAAALGVGPAYCAAIENAPRGVRSARAAGYAFVVGLPTTVSKTALTAAGAHVVVESHADAAQAVADWVRRTSVR